MAEMIEGRHAEFVSTIRHGTGATAAAAKREVNHAIDRLVAFAGWTDKFSQVLGCHNPVAGPYYNFTIPEPTGVVGIVPPGRTVAARHDHAARAGALRRQYRDRDRRPQAPAPALLLGEVCATSDVPGGVINVLSGRRSELLEPLASHRGIDAISAANLRRPERTLLRTEAADNLKRIHHERVRDDDWTDARFDARGRSNRSSR